MFWVGTSLQQSHVVYIELMTLTRLWLGSRCFNWPKSIKHLPSRLDPHTTHIQAWGNARGHIRFCCSMFHRVKMMPTLLQAFSTSYIITYITQTNQILPCIIFVLYKAVCFHTKCIHLYIYWLNKRLYIVSSANTRLTPFRASRLCPLLGGCRQHDIWDLEILRLRAKDN